MSPRDLRFLLALSLLAAAPPSEWNGQVLEYARGHLGQTVGRGECYDLADQALNHAGARRFPPHGPDADYVWGQPLQSLNEVQPGDILQFRNARFQGWKRFPNGAFLTWSQTFPHHTAIVSGVKRTRSGLVITLLHQNIDSPEKDEAKRRRVQEGTIRMAELQPGGWVRAYRPVGE